LLLCSSVRAKVCIFLSVQMLCFLPAFDLLVAYVYSANLRSFLFCHTFLFYLVYSKYRCFPIISVLLSMGYIHRYYYVWYIFYFSKSGAFIPQMSYHLFGSLSNILLPMDNLLFPSLIQAKMGAHGWNNPALNTP
jgi:hypothetical protein